MARRLLVAGTSAFVHLELWHLGNLYWLWILGCGVEHAIGETRFLGLVLAASLVSSTFQLAFGDSTGIDASGIVHALVGFVCFARSRYPELRVLLTNQTIALFILWQLFCFGLTRSGVLQIGNAAHVSGFVFERPRLVSTVTDVCRRPGVRRPCTREIR